MAEIVTGIGNVRASIRGRLQGQLGAGGMLNGVAMFNGQVTDSERVPTSNGVILPYFCLVFGGRGPVARSLQGIASNRLELKRFAFGVEAYGANIEECDDLADRIEDVLVGFEPVNAGEIESLNSGRIENPADVKQNHSRDGIGLIFSCYTNTITPDVAI